MMHMRQGRQLFICISFAASLASVIGCASTAHYEVVSPGQARGGITANAGRIVSRDKIDYELFRLEDKVVIRFVNRTGVPIRLNEQSVSVDSTGRAFMIDPQEVAPDEAGRVILPPSFGVDRNRPAAVATPVRIGGIDEGGLIGTRRDIESNVASGASGSAAAPAPGFRWRAGTQARVRLVYELMPTPQIVSDTQPTTPPASQPASDATTITHEWAIRRIQ